MRLRKIHIIVNPAAGNNEPVLSYLNDALHPTGIEWEVFLTHGRGDATELAKKAVIEKADAVAVYGGDGTVMEVAQGLYKTSMPLAIIPGGTANVMAKELGIPITTTEAIDLLKTKKVQKKVIDMAVVDDKPFIIRLNMGILAEMVKSTRRSVKDKFGVLAYVGAAIKHTVTTPKEEYHLLIDDKKVKTKGVALVIANSGNIGIQGVSFLPTIDITDGLLDVIVFRTKNPKTLLAWATSHIAGEKPNRHIRHWKAKKVKVILPSVRSIILDDVPVKTKEINASITPSALTVLVPKDKV
jgi:diacylglycerol kinase (ATP)